MIDLVKKAMFTGIGVISLSKDKVEELAREFREKGKLSESEGEKLVDDLLKKSEESRKELQKQVETHVQSLVVKMDLASQKDLDKIKQELAEIKEQLSELRS